VTTTALAIATHESGSTTTDDRPPPLPRDNSSLRHRLYTLSAFTFNLETTDGTPADPPSFQTVAPQWRRGDMIPLGPGRALRVVGERVSGADETPVLIVEDVSN